MQGNFIKTTGAYEIDTTNLTVEEVIDMMLNIIKK